MVLASFALKSGESQLVYHGMFFCIFTVILFKPFDYFLEHTHVLIDLIYHLILHLKIFMKNFFWLLRSRRHLVSNKPV